MFATRILHIIVMFVVSYLCCIQFFYSRCNAYLVACLEPHQLIVPFWYEASRALHGMVMLTPYA
jgi:hypothetical protein